MRRRDAKRSAAPQWRKIFEANYHRSLDHRSFYFKQVDKRHLGAKGMVQVRSQAAAVCCSAEVCTRNVPYVSTILLCSHVCGFTLHSLLGMPKHWAPEPMH